LLDVRIGDARVCCGDRAPTESPALERRRRRRCKGSDVMKQFIVWARAVGGADDTEAGGSFRRPGELRRLIELSKSSRPLKSSPVV
jgi:hypothetical protein